MSDTVLGIVVSHAALGASLVDVVGAITGRTDRLIAVSNEGCGREAIFERLSGAIANRPAVVFVDLPGGSCHAAALRLQKQLTGLPVVGGVNLPMLLEFVMHPSADAAEAARRAVEAGNRAITATTNS